MFHLIVPHFFPVAKRKFTKFSYFVKNFFERVATKGESLGKNIPYFAIDRPQKPPNGPFLSHTAYKKTAGVDEPQVAPAYGKA